MKEDVFITVKTYPTLSAKYGELVCTAGFTRDGRFIRIYPIPFRKLEKELRYKKYQWVTFDIERNTNDPRPDSFRIVNPESIELGEIFNTDCGTWHRRKEIILNNVYTNINKLITDAKDKRKITSLAVFKPKKIIDFKVEETEREWDKEKLELIKSQGDLFEKDTFDIVDKVPYKFSYIFTDDEDRESKLMNEDWELGQLYWNCLKSSGGNEKLACKKVVEKYFDDFAKTKDLYFYLGTLRIHHFRAKNPFVIIGTIYPKHDEPGLF